MRQAIMADPVWDNGKYVLKMFSQNGLAVAKCWTCLLSEKGMQEKFGRKYKKKQITITNADFQVELRHQGYAFVKD